MFDQDDELGDPSPGGRIPVSPEGPGAHEGHEEAAPSGEEDVEAPGPFDPTPTSRRLAPAYVPAARVAGAITTVVFTLTGTTGVVIVWFASNLSTPWKGAILGGVLALLVGSGLLAYLWPALEYARTSWSIDEDGIEIRRGVVWRHAIFVPRSRIQHTDVSQGPLQRRFGLSTLVINTAGTHESAVNLDGIERGTALEARDALLENGRGDGA